MVTRIAVAQLQAIKGDIAANIEKHIAWIRAAAANGNRAIFFPELSLTGYEPELANQLATTMDDIRLDRFQQLSDESGITINVGLPTISTDGILISMIIFQPQLSRILYSKQQLHEDELPFFIEGNGQVLLSIDDVSIAPAICYESLQEPHAQQAHELGAAVYITSVAKSQKGVDKAFKHYPEMAQRFGMTVMMSNATGYCDNFQSAGQSGVWNAEGELIYNADTTSEGILSYDMISGEAIFQSLHYSTPSIL